MQNGVFINNADKVIVDGFFARNYKGNGFFVTNANGYTFTHLVAKQTGVYGLYAFNTIGGKMLHSEAYYVNDGAFYIGQTPPQDKPVQSIVRDVDGWGSPIGFSATTCATSRSPRAASTTTASASSRTRSTRRSSRRRSAT